MTKVVYVHLYYQVHDFFLGQDLISVVLTDLGPRVTVVVCKKEKEVECRNKKRNTQNKGQFEGEVSSETDEV